MPNSKPCNRRLLGLVALQERKVNNLYNSAARKISVILTKYKSKSKRNVWLGNLTVQKEVDVVMAGFETDMLGMIKTQMGSSWGMADNCSDGVVNKYLRGQKLAPGVKDAMLYKNPAALTSFVNRRRAGLNLSERVFNITKGTKLQFEQLLASGVMDGRSAQGMAADLRRYLKEPNKQFRRIRNDAGKLVLSNPAQAYHPGQGVYRSSHQNALRLARNEVNMSYRHNDHLRRQAMPFVTGVTVHLSGSHPTADICNDMQGDYPKTFKFGGWHPNCICYTTSKLLPKKEFVDYLKTGKIKASRNVVGIPKGATAFLKKNADTLAGYKNTPYFLADNFDLKKGTYNFHNRNQIINNAKLADLDSQKLYSKNGVYTPERRLLHDGIIRKLMNDVPHHQGKKQYMLGGATANGKSTLVKSGRLPHPKGILTVNSDDIKALIPEYNVMLANGDTLAASFVHEESSMLAKRLIDTAQKANKSFVLDGVNDGSFDGLLKKISGYKKGGKTVRADFVSLDADLSLKLARERAEKTGRFVPDEFTISTNKEISKLVPKLLERNALDELYLWDTNKIGVPRLILKQVNGKLTIYNQKLYDRFLAKALDTAAEKAAKSAAKAVAKRAAAKAAKKAAAKKAAKKAAAQKAAKKTEFTPAKTIKEAEDFAIQNNFAKKINYEGASLDFVNAFNKTMLEESKKRAVGLFEISFDASQAQILGFTENSIIMGRGSLLTDKRISEIFIKQRNNALLYEDGKKYYNASSRIANDAIYANDRKNIKALANKIREGHIKHEMNHAYESLFDAMRLGGFGREHSVKAKKWFNAFKNEIRKSHRIKGEWKPSGYVNQWVKQTTAEREWFSETKLLYDHNPAWIENPVLRKLMGEFDELYKPITTNIEKTIAIERAEVTNLMKLAKESAPEVDAFATEMAERFGGYTTPVNLKREVSLLRKLRGKYDGDINRLADAVRTTIIVDEKYIDEILAIYRKNSNFTKVARQSGDSYLGYSGSITNYRNSKGILAEIQINTERMIFGKETPRDAQRIIGVKRWNEIRRKTGLEGGLGHKYYEEYRKLNKNIPAQAKRMRELLKLSTTYYTHFF